MEKSLDLKENTTLVLYADDTSIALANSSLNLLVSQANKILQRFSPWCKINKLILNETKTQYLVFCKKRTVSDFTLKINNTKIKKVEHLKFLGLHLDSHLTWSPHVDYVAGKLNSAYFAIINLKGVLSQGQLLNVYYALVYSHLKYMVLYWGQAVESRYGHD